MKLRTKTEINEFMQAVSHKGMVMTLAPLKALCKLLNNPQNDTAFVHIAGTNGKGSVLSMVSSCLEDAGYKTGRFFSPQVFEDEPALSVNGCAPNETIYIEIMSELMEAYEMMQSQGLETPTAFELEVLAAFMYFSRTHCDIAVVECGMGGRDDATNVITSNAVCVITPIGIDHTKFLGNSITEIADNKSDIFTKDCIAVTAQQPTEAIDVLKRKAAAVGCELIICKAAENVVQNGFDGQSFDYLGKNYKMHLCGSHQSENGAVAVQTLLALRRKGFEISDENIRTGLIKASWHGRFECIRQNPLIIIDGAHNVAAAKVFANSIDEYLPDKKIIFVFGILKDKQYKEVIRITAPKADKIITFTPPSERALDGRELAGICSRYAPSEYAQSPEQAAKLALKTAEEIGYSDTAICAFGSLYSLERLRKIFLK